MPRPSLLLDATASRATFGNGEATQNTGAQMSETQIEIATIGSLGEIPQPEWDLCACPEAADGSRPMDPFTTHRFLHALEASGSVGTGTGWTPHYLTARSDGELIGVAPLYAKGHSQGEYIFDHSWAHAYERAGGRYYPKLQMAVPFTPASGRRLSLIHI